MDITPYKQTKDDFLKQLKKYTNVHTHVLTDGFVIILPNEVSQVKNIEKYVFVPRTDWWAYCGKIYYGK